ASASYRAFWALVGSPQSSALFLKQKARALPVASDLPAVINRWILDLENLDPAVREAAAQPLARYIDHAAPVLADAATNSLLPEVRDRAATLLKEKDQRGPWPDPAVQAMRALRFMNTPESRACLEQLAKGPAGS